jgi:transcriptional regulator with PAS, ATPase and Fis domain
MTETQKENKQDDLLTAALRMTASMAVEENVIALLRQGLSLCIKVLNCDRGLLISESSDGSREIIEHQGSGDKNTPYSNTAIQLVKEKQEPLLISDTVSDELLGAQESIARQDIRSVLCARLDALKHAFADKQVYLYLDSQTTRQSFTMDDLETFRLLSLLMANLVKKSELLVEQEAVIEELKNRVHEKQFEDLIFGSESFEKCLTLVKQGASADVPILLIGETGTGKEALARIVHNLSSRKDNPFLAVNCGAIPENLIESELFGHEKGAFTGAVGMKRGYFEEASGGTLFLDEVGELPPQVQASFLRALQEGEITRIGSSKPIKVDVRIVSATNVNLENAVDSGSFRKDLYYRLNVFPVEVPPIRQRGEDSLLLARYFLKNYCETYASNQLKFTSDCEKAILAYDWPGNVREIQNHIQRAVITAGGTTISRSDLGLGKETSSKFATLKDAREAVDREMIQNALSRSPNNLTNAAKILDIDRKSLRLLLEKYNIKQE